MNWYLPPSSAGIANLSEDSTPQLGGDLDANNNDIDNAKVISFSEYDNGNSGSSITINWNNGIKQKVTLNDNPTISFTDPPGACNLVLK